MQATTPSEATTFTPSPTETETSNTPDDDEFLATILDDN
jgi:hypothetical protein